MRTIQYFLNHTFEVIFIVWSIRTIIAERLECYMCSEISPNLRCSINKTATRMAEDDIEYRCRIWALNGIPVNKDLVPKSLCTEKVLSNQMSNFFNNQFSGPGPAQALCCSWSKCNADIRLAALREPPTTSSEATTSQQPSTVSSTTIKTVTTSSKTIATTLTTTSTILSTTSTTTKITTTKTKFTSKLSTTSTKKPASIATTTKTSSSSSPIVSPTLPTPIKNSSVPIKVQSSIQICLSLILIRYICTTSVSNQLLLQKCPGKCNSGSIAKELCTEEMLANQIAHFFNTSSKISGTPQALCCSWTKCSASVQLAGLEKALATSTTTAKPTSNKTSLLPSAGSNAINIQSMSYANVLKFCMATIIVGMSDTLIMNT